MSDDILKVAMGGMMDWNNISAAVKQLWLQTGYMNTVLIHMRQNGNSLQADLLHQQYVLPAMNTLVPYMPFLVNMYPNEFPPEAHKAFGVD